MVLQSAAAIDNEVLAIDDVSPGDGQFRDAYLTTFPEAEPITALGDFAFFVLRVTGGRLVTGFGGAANVTEESLAALRGSGSE